MTNMTPYSFTSTFPFHLKPITAGTQGERDIQVTTEHPLMFLQVAAN